jgi:hydroxyacylglutathione hydrolase
MQRVHLKLSFLLVLSLLLTIIVYAQPKPAKIPSHPWFKIKKINETIWRIADGEIDNIYLVFGKDKALLIDNGVGAYDLQKFATSITDLPLILVNTHSHPDHTGSLFQFPEVYAHPDDFEMIRFFSRPERKMKIPAPDSLRYPVTDSTFLAKLLPVTDGYVFDLGDRKLEVVHVPGHTKGSICLLDRKDKFLFTGDNDNGLVWLHTLDALPLEIYLRSLQKLTAREKEFSTLLPAHGDPIDKEFIKEQITCVKEIISGKCVGKPYESFVGPGLVCGYKRAQVVYDPKKIKEQQ